MWPPKLKTFTILPFTECKPLFNGEMSVLWATFSLPNLYKPSKITFYKAFKKAKKYTTYPSWPWVVTTPGPQSNPCCDTLKKKKSQQIWKGFHPTQDKSPPALLRTQFQRPGKSVRLDSAHPLDLSSCGGQEGLKLKGQIALTLTSQRSNSCLDKWADSIPVWYLTLSL